MIIVREWRMVLVSLLSLSNQERELQKEAVLEIWILLFTRNGGTGWATTSRAPGDDLYNQMGQSKESESCHETKTGFVQVLTLFIRFCRHKRLRIAQKYLISLPLNGSWKMSWFLFKNIQWFHAYKCWNRSWTVVSGLADILPSCFQEAKRSNNY